MPGKFIYALLMSVMEQYLPDSNSEGAKIECVVQNMTPKLSLQSKNMAF